MLADYQQIRAERYQPYLHLTHSISKVCWYNLTAETEQNLQSICHTLLVYSILSLSFWSSSIKFLLAFSQPKKFMHFKQFGKYTRIVKFIFFFT